MDSEISAPGNEDNKLSFGYRLTLKHWRLIGLTIITILIVGLGCLLFALRSDPFIDKLIIFTGSGVLLGGLIHWAWLHWLTSIETGRIIKQARPFQQDLFELGLGVSSISQANLTHRFSLTCKPEDRFVTALDKDRIDTFNGVVGLLNESIQCLNAITSEAGRHLCYVGSQPFLEGRSCGEPLFYPVLQKNCWIQPSNLRLNSPIN
ncbi:MAG: hypothetical protein LWX83_09920 [Anaerolineae bacterium]|nr:hypothetical protein [Anaerolineae bacterium]